MLLALVILLKAHSLACGLDRASMETYRLRTVFPPDTASLVRSTISRPALRWACLIKLARGARHQRLNHKVWLHGRDFRRGARRWIPPIWEYTRHRPRA